MFANAHGRVYALAGRDESRVLYPRASRFPVRLVDFLDNTQFFNTYLVVFVDPYFNIGCRPICMLFLQASSRRVRVVSWRYRGYATPGSHRVSVPCRRWRLCIRRVRGLRAVHAPTRCVGSVRSGITPWGGGVWCAVTLLASNQHR